MFLDGDMGGSFLVNVFDEVLDKGNIGEIEKVLNSV